MKLITDIEKLLDSGVEAVTVSAKNMRRILARVTVASNGQETKRLKLALYRVGCALDRIADEANIHSNVANDGRKGE